MSPLKTPNGQWQSLLGSPGSGTSLRFAGDTGQRLLQAAVPSDTSPLALYVQATVRSGSVAVTTSRGGSVVPVLDLEPITGNASGAARAVAVELPPGADELVLQASSPRTVIDVEVLAYGPAGALGSFATADGVSQSPSATQPNGQSTSDRSGGGASAGRAASQAQAQAQATLKPRDTKPTGNGGDPGDAKIVAIAITNPNPSPNTATTYPTEAGVPIAGTATTSAVFSFSIEVAVTFNGVKQWSGAPTLTKTGPTSYQWNVSVPQNVLTDQHLASAQYGVTATISASGAIDDAATSQFLVHDLPVELSLSPAITSTSVTALLSFTASSDSGVDMVQWTTDPNSGWQPVRRLDGSPGNPSRTGAVTVSLPAVNGTPAANGASTVIYFLCQNSALDAPNGNPRTNQVVVTVTWRDRTAPILSWTEPQDGAAIELLGDSASAQVSVLVSIDDAANGAVSAGVAAGAVTCSVDGQTPVPLVQEAGSEFWSAVVTIASEGPHVLTLDAKDGAGNPAAQQTRQLTVRESGIQGVAEQDYLVDLLAFMGGRLYTRADATSHITADHLEVALCQPVRQLAGVGAVRVGTAAALAPINAVRGVIEVLRAYLGDPPPAPIAHWPLDDGSTASAARDDTGGGSNGTLNAISWLAGPPGATTAAAFDGASSSVITRDGQLTVQGANPATTRVSLSAWINPSRLGTGSGDPAGVVTLCGWCSLAVAANGHVQIIEDGGQTVDTGVAVTTGTWTHIAVTYDGANVTAYINSAPSAPVAAAALAGDNSPGCAIGRGKIGGQFYEGAIADVGVYNVVLSAANVQTLAAPASVETSLSQAFEQSNYLSVVYEAILTGLGTTSEELRSATRAPSDTRAALGDRLGIALNPVRPDQLDQLLLTPGGTGAGALDEPNLASLFALQPIDADPLAPAADAPSLFLWQQTALRAAWMNQDYATSSPNDYTAPIIDPDVVLDEDVSNPSDPLGQAALNLRSGPSGRVKWLADTAGALSRPGAGTGLLDLVTAQLGMDLSDLAAQSGQGSDITDQLAAVPMAVDAFNRLATLAALPDALRDDEWADASAIIVQVLKTRQFPQWRQEEQSLGLVLDPAIFTAQPLTPDQLPQWRATWAARVQWQQRLSARSDQLRALDGALAATVAAAEQTALPALRDALLEIAAPPGDGGAALLTPEDRLGLHLGLDLRVGPTTSTTRCGQATAALSQLLASIDSSGALPSSLGVPWVVDQAAVSTAEASSLLWYDRFQGELIWMSSYSQWLAAMTVFLYPENYLLPSIRPTESAPFANLVADVTGGSSPPTSTQTARSAAATYWNTGWGNAQPFDGLPPHGSNDDKYPYTEDLSDQALTLLQQNNADPKGNRETYFDVPLQLALSLRNAGAWQAAMAWMRIIYDLDRPEANRWIFDPTKIESAPGGITRDESDWLAGGQLDPHALASTRGFCYQRFVLMTVAGILCDWADAEFTADTTESRAHAASLYFQALGVLQEAQGTYQQTVVPFITTNDDLTTLVGRATSGLAQMRAGLNIAGMVRPLSDGDANPTAVPPATNLRYAALIARAQQLVTSAGQIEASYLASLQQEDNENYQQLLAQQDLTVAGAQVQVAFDQAIVAHDQIQVAQLQVQRAQTQSDTYQAWIEAGPNSFEQDQLAQVAVEQQFQGWATQAQEAGAVLGGLGQLALGAVTAAGLGAIGGTIEAAAGVANALGIQNAGAAQQAALTSQADALQASWERRQDEWTLQKQLADTDVDIGQQQMVIAQAQANIADQQAQIAQLNQNNAGAKLQFLQTKFTNGQLYTWMAGVLSGVYRYFLQQAASVARLAEQQLAFERQVPVPGYIKADYWTPPTGNSSGGPIGAGGVPATGTGGLTGSARLSEDISQLDEFALDTEQRKLQLTQTFSLAALAPIDLQRFRQTGVLPFAIPMSNWGTPGLYLAAIRAVRINIAALIPPTQGIRGSLTSGGTSHIVIPNGDGFQTVTLARPPETIALTSPAGASGVFQVDLTPELLLPFEGSGLDLPFQLELPPPINWFDYRTIADVQVSVDFTALYSAAYSARVIRQQPALTSNSISLSLRDQPDAWYTLLSQAQRLGGDPTATGDSPAVLIATWQLGSDDLPTTLSATATTASLTLMVIRSNSDTAQFTIDHLTLLGAPSPGNPTATKTVSEIVSTRNGSGAAWTALCTGSPIGSWELGITGETDAISAIGGGDVQDLVLVIGYTASLPAWT